MIERDIKIPVEESRTRPMTWLTVPYGEPENPTDGELWHDGETIYAFLDGEKRATGPVE